MPFHRRPVLAVLVAAALVAPTTGVALGAEGPVPSPGPAERTGRSVAAAGTDDADVPGWVRSRDRRGARSADVVRIAVRARAGASSATLSSIGKAARAEGGTEAQTFSRLRTVSVAVPRALAGVVARRLESRGDVVEVTTLHQRYLGLVPNDLKWSATSSYLGSVDAPAAWDVHTGDPSVTIAVIDSGVDVGHPDLAGRVVGQFNAASETDTTDVTDEIGHGTFVAGVAAATPDNGIGIAGASYGASVLAVKVADENGEIWTDALANGIRWAADNGADVINLSLGSPSTDPTESAAIAYARSKGVVVVAAAGNDGWSAKSYPAATAGVISVGATDAAGHRADFSNYGSWVKVAAPGVDITSTTPRVGSVLFPKNYSLGDGTSFSTPIVAAEAALLRSARPGLSGTDVEKAIVASAHGYSGLGLGAGQVDLRDAFDALRPGSVPTLTAPTAGATVEKVVSLTASSTAPKVRFLVDGQQLGALVPTSGGTASTPWSTWGLPQGSHSVAVADCSVADLCAPAGSPVTVTLDNDAPAITAPTSGETVSGRVTFAATAPGGAVGFFVDGTRVGLDTTAPYTLPFPMSSVADGNRTVTVTGCSSAGVCDGPSASVDVVNASLHPVLTGVSPSVFSPNGDTRSDSTKVSWTLPDAETVQFLVRDGSGTVVRGPVHLGTQSAGSHAYTWNGTLNSGAKAGTGTYTVEIATSATVDGTPRSGSAWRTVRVDLTAPRISSISRSASTVYPVDDGYKDTVSARFTLDEKATVTLTVRNGSGSVVRRITAAKPVGRSSIVWNGRTASGTKVAAGTYSWTLTAQDAAGNRRVSARSTFGVSLKKLVTRSTTLTKSGTSIQFAGTTGSTSCGGYAPGSRFTNGLWLVNDCSGDVITFAGYRFTAPSAIRYSAVRLQSYGNTRSAAELGGTFRVWENDGVRDTGEIRVGKTVAYRTIGSTLSASGLVNSKRSIDLYVYVPATYDQNDYDIGKVRLVVSYKVLG